MKRWLRSWTNPVRPGDPPVITDSHERRAIAFELVIVFSITLGLKAAESVVSFANSALSDRRLSDQQVALHRSQADVELLDLIAQLLGVLRLVAWAALGAYLLWRAGIGLRRIGLGRRITRIDVLWSLGLTALIGIPGLTLYLIAVHAGGNLEVVPSALDATWWRPITLTLSAIGNSLAEEVLVVGYLLTRLRQLGWSENAGLLVSAVLRGLYHLYQGIGGLVGNLAMGLIFGRLWQRTNRLWPLVFAHALLDIIAFVGYALLHEHVSWLPSANT